MQRYKFFRSGAKNGSFFCEGLACVLGQNQMCYLCGWLKIVFKKFALAKKNGVGQRVGFLAVR
ncbi:hypothetical protein BPO_1046 [Bergeyella porcorum]|uniref:Uncharacterized protein n=1 Tax=Bergeyella porcorum TaxID=1735111 RepID=A0AAU0F4I8_9FLAO